MVPLALKLAGGGLTVAVGAGEGAATLWLIGYDGSHETQIGRGENSGLTEREANIVRSIRPVALWHGAPLSLDLPKPAGEPAAILLQRTDGTILSAAALPSPHA